MEIEKRQLWDKKTGKDFVPVGHTDATLTPTGETAEARNTRQIEAVQGVGKDANAYLYPFMSLGDVSTIEEVNSLLDTVYHTTDVKYQGRLRIKCNGQILWIDQTAINYTKGYWMQVAYGPYAPSIDGSGLTRDGENFHVSWRMHTLGMDKAWRDAFQPIVMKTINGQSVIGYGNITIDTQQQITVDTELNGSSSNAIANSAVSSAMNELQEQIDGKASKNNGITLINVWSETIDETHYVRPEGALWWTGHVLYKKINGEWIDVTDEEEYEDSFFLRQSDSTVYWYTGGGEMLKLFYDEFRTLEFNTKTHFYDVEGALKSNSLPGSSWQVVEGKYTGIGGEVWIDTYGTPRPLLAVWENPGPVCNLYTDWTYNDERKSPSYYHFTKDDYYIYNSLAGSGPGVIVAHYSASSWYTSEELNTSDTIPKMYDVAYNEDDIDEQTHLFPDGDENHKYAMDNTLIYGWSSRNNEWVEISGTDEWYPVLVKFKNKIIQVWADEMQVLWDFTPDSELDAYSTNSVQNKVVASYYDEIDNRLLNVESIAGGLRGMRVLPIDGVLPDNFTYLPEDRGYAGSDGELLLDVTNGRVVLAVTEDDGEEIATLYYVDWNENGGRLPDDAYDLTDSDSIIFVWTESGNVRIGKLSGGSLVEVGTGDSPVAITIDNALNTTSSNPIANYPVANAINTLNATTNSLNNRLLDIEADNVLNSTPILPFDGFVTDYDDYATPVTQQYTGPGGKVLVDEAGRRCVLRVTNGNTVTYYTSWNATSDGRLISTAYYRLNAMLWRVDGGNLHIYKYSGTRLVEVVDGNAISNLQSRVAAIENATTRMISTIRVWGGDYEVSDVWNVGDLWYDEYAGRLYVCTDNRHDQPVFDDTWFTQGVIYYDAATNKWYVWDDAEAELDELVKASNNSTPNI